MNRFAPRLRWAMLGLCLSWTLSGCTSLSRPLPERSSYRLDVTRPQTLARSPSAPVVLRVDPVNLSPGFDGRQLVFRRDSHRFENDFYHLYQAPPADLLSLSQQEWLRQSGVAQAVARAADGQLSQYQLLTDVEALYGDWRQQDTSAVVVVRFTLLRMHGRERLQVWSQRYEEHEPCPADATQLTPALSRAWGRALQQLEQALPPLLQS